MALASAFDHGLVEYQSPQVDEEEGEPTGRDHGAYYPSGRTFPSSPRLSIVRANGAKRKAEQDEPCAEAAQQHAAADCAQADCERSSGTGA